MAARRSAAAPASQPEGEAEKPHSPRNRKAKPDTGSAYMWLVSPLPEKVYATSAHPKWLRPRPTALLCAIVNMVGMYIAALATQQDQTASTSVFLFLAVLSFAHRLVVYAAIHWLWYVIDYCVIHRTIRHIIYQALRTSPCRSFFAFTSPALFSTIASALIGVRLLPRAFPPRASALSPSLK